MARLRVLFLISLKNIFRNKRRTILTLLILVLGSTGLILVGGFFDSLMDRLKEGYILSSTGHFQISQEGYFREGFRDPLAFVVPDAQGIRKKVENLPYVTDTFSKLKFGGMLSTDESSVPVFALGVEPEWEAMLNKKIYPGLTKSYVGMEEGEPLSEQDPYGIHIGVELKEAMGLKVGDFVSFITSQRMGAIEGAEFQVKGVFRSSIRDIGGRLIKLPIKTAQEILGVSGGIHTLHIIIDETEKTAQRGQDLVPLIKNSKLNLEIIPWRQQSIFYEQSDRFLGYIYHTIQIILSVIFFISIANIINMTLFERMREYGTMMAIGNRRTTVSSLIIMEAGIIGFIGGLLGLLIGILVGKLLTSFGFLIPAPPNINMDIFLMILISSKLLLSTFIICFSATVLSSLIPAYRASHASIITSLGYT